MSIGVEPYLSRIIYKNGIITQFTSPKNFKKLFSFSTTLTLFFEQWIMEIENENLTIITSLSVGLKKCEWWKLSKPNMVTFSSFWGPRKFIKFSWSQLMEVFPSFSQLKKVFLPFLHVKSLSVPALNSIWGLETESEKPCAISHMLVPLPALNCPKAFLGPLGKQRVFFFCKNKGFISLGRWRP